MSVGINSRNIDDMHPTVARGCREWINRMAQNGFTSVGISATYRDNTHQDWLYAQGRTIRPPDSIVTNARGGQSIHNYRLGFDFYRNIPGQAYNDSTPAERRFWDEGGRIWMAMGGEWGGSWKGLVDRPHCEFTGGLTLQDLQAGHRMADNFRMPWEILKEEKEVRFRTIKDIPDWARPDIQRLIDVKILSGTGFDEKTGERVLDISEDMMRTLILTRKMILAGDRL